MCGGGPLYDIVRHDSQNAAHLGNMIGGKLGQYVQQEGETNEKNPGRALTKAAISAATWYLGSAAGDALGSGSTAGTASTDAAESGGTLGLNAAGQAVPYAAQGAGASGSLAAQQALQYAGGIDPETAAGAGGMSVAQNGIGPGTYANQVRGLLSNPSSALSANGMPANIANSLLSSGGNSGEAKSLAMQMALKSMQPQQPQQPMPMRMGGGYQQQQPLPTPYPEQNSLLGGQSSVSANLPPPGVSFAEWIRRKQMGGY